MRMFTVLNGRCFIFPQASYTHIKLCLFFSVSDCKTNWHQYKTGCVRLFTSHKIEALAREHCRQFQISGGVKGDLVEIMSQDDNDRIVDLASEQGMYSRKQWNEWNKRHKNYCPTSAMGIFNYYKLCEPRNTHCNAIEME